MNEEKILLRKVSNIEARLSNVETTLDLFRDQILENENRIEEGLQESLSDLKHDLEKNSLEVRKLQRRLHNKLSLMHIFYVVVGILVIWTILVHVY